MVEKFLKWFFSEIEMYGPGIHAGIFGNYIVDKIIGTPISNIDLFVYSESKEWDNIKDNLIQHIQDVWNIFQMNKIKIEKKHTHYTFTINDIDFRIFSEKPYLRTIFTFQTLQYNWNNKKFNLSHNTNITDPLFLIKTLNNIKRKKIIPLYLKNLILDHNFFIADREYYMNIVEQSYHLINYGWYFDSRNIRMHTCIDGVCSICRNEDLNIKLQIECGHKFHKDCLKQLILLEPSEKHCNLCPNCRTPIQVFYE